MKLSVSRNTIQTIETRRQETRLDSRALAVEVTGRAESGIHFRRRSLVKRCGCLIIRPFDVVRGSPSKYYAS